MDPRKSKASGSKPRKASKMTRSRKSEDQKQIPKLEESSKRSSAENRGQPLGPSAENVTTPTTTTTSLSSNELWWSILPFSRARRLWLLLRNGLYRLVERMKRAEMQVAHMTHGLESLRRLEVPTGLLAVAQDVEGSRLVVLDSAGQLHLHGEDGWARGHTTVPIELTGLVALVGFRHLSHNSGRFVGWGPEGIAVLSEELQLLSSNSVEPSRVPVCCALLPDKGTVVTGEVGGGLSMWEFRGGGRRLVLANTVAPAPIQGRSRPCALSRMALDMAPRGVFPRCFAVCGSDLLTYDLATCTLVDVRRELHKTIISDVVFCRAAEAVVTASRDSTVKVWEADWQIRSVFVGHTGPVTALAVLPGSALVLSASQDMTLRTWNLESAQQVGEVSLRSHSDSLSGVRPDTGEENEPPPTTSFSVSFETVSHLHAPGRPGAPLVAQGQTFLELWRVRELHEPMVALCANLQSMELVPQLPQPDRYALPQRLLGRCADGTVRIFSAISGRVISTLLLAPGESAVAEAYCLPREILLVLTHEGVLLRCNALRCPIRVLRRVQPPQPPHAYPCCLHLINHVPDQMRAHAIWLGVRERGGELRKKSWLGTTWEDKNRFLPVLGYTDGTIAVLDWQSFRKLFHADAHGPGPTTTIASNAQILVTSGMDLTVKMWQVFPYSEESLTLLRTFFCYQPAVALCPLGNRVTVAFEDPNSATYSVVQYGTADSDEPRFDHPPKDDPTDHITGLCCCPYLKLFATSSLDCTLRIWTGENKLLRLMHLNMPPEAITFYNDMGDLILAMGSHLCRLSHRLYLPTSYLVKVLCRKMPPPKDDPPVPLTNPEQLTSEELKKIKGLPTVSGLRMKHTVKQEYLDAENKQLEIEEACARLAARDEEVRKLALGRAEPLAQMLSSPRLRLEAFHNYLQIIYGSRLESVSKEEYEALRTPGLTFVDRKPLISLVAKSSLCETLGMDLDALDAPFTAETAPTTSPKVKRIRKRRRIPLTERTLESCTDIIGFFPSYTTQPQPPSTKDKKIHPLIRFPGYIPNSVILQKLWHKKDLAGIGNLAELESQTIEVVERALDTMWLPWGTRKKKERAWLRKALNLGPDQIPDFGDLDETNFAALQQKLLPELTPEGEIPMDVVAPELHSRFDSAFSSLDSDWDPASIYIPKFKPFAADFIATLMKEEWFRRLFPDFSLEKYPECNTMEGLANLLLSVLDQVSYEDGTKILMVLLEMMSHLGTEFRTKLNNLLLVMLNKEPPPSLMEKIQKKFVMMALQALMIVSVGSRDVVLELMSYFLYSPSQCRPTLKKLLEQMGLKDPDGFLFNEMLTWAEGKGIETKADLRERCSQKLEAMIQNLQVHLTEQPEVHIPLEEDEDEKISISGQEEQSLESPSPVLHTSATELPQVKPPHPPPPTPTSKSKTAVPRSRSRDRPKGPRDLVYPRRSPRPSLKEPAKRPAKLSPKREPGKLPTLSSKAPLTPSPTSQEYSPELVSPLDSERLSPLYTRSLDRVPYHSQRAMSEPLKLPQIYEQKYFIHHSAPAILEWGSQSLYFESLMPSPPEPESPPIPTVPHGFKFEVTVIDALNFFCELLQLRAEKDRLKMTGLAERGRPNTIVMTPREILETYHSTKGRKIMRLQEHKRPLATLDAAGMANFLRARYRMGTISRSLKLPLPRVEPIPFPSAWPPASRPLPPLILEDSLQRYFLPKLARPENYR